MSLRDTPAGAGSRRRAWLALIFLLAAAQYAWNAVHVTPLTDYDAGGHADYILTLVEERRLPRPLEGWSTFHPPVYYLVAAGVWTLLAPLGPLELYAGLRAISVASILAAAAVLARLLAARGAPPALRLLALALALFLPASQLAGSMLGNEALGVAFAALALPAVLELQRAPGRLGAALCAGLFAGLALATKFTGLFVAAACAVPFLRRGLDRRALGAAALLAGCVAGIAGPVYLRNALLTGSPLPMTRAAGPAKWWESKAILRERSIGDYLGFPPSVLARPTMVGAGAPAGPLYNEALQNVWGAAYASLWFDAFVHRIPHRFHRGAVPAGALLACLGLVPTALVLLGLALALRELLQAGARAPDAPLLAMSAVALLAFVAFTARAPSLVAAKGSYLLPLLVPAGLFFARGAEALPARVRRPALAGCAAAVLAAAVVFTSGLVFPTPNPEAPRQVWSTIAKQLPRSHIGEAVALFLGPGR